MHKRGVIHRDLKPELLGMVGLGSGTRKLMSKRSRVVNTNHVFLDVSTFSSVIREMLECGCGRKEHDGDGRRR